MEIAVFDFCDTLFDGQSLNLFINYYSSKKRINKYYITFLGFLYTKGLLRQDIFNALKLRVFRGLKRDDYDKLCCNFYNDVIKDRLSQRLMNEVTKRVTNAGQHKTILLSGALSGYLECLKNEYHIDHVISSELAFSDGKCLGKLAGPECIGLNKVHYLNDFLKKHAFEFNRTIFFTDHFSDMILYPFFNHVYIVIKKESKPDWVKFLKLDTIDF